MLYDLLPSDNCFKRKVLHLFLYKLTTLANLCLTSHSEMFISPSFFICIWVLQVRNWSEEQPKSGPAGTPSTDFESNVCENTAPGETELVQYSKCFSSQGNFQNTHKKLSIFVVFANFRQKVFPAGTSETTSALFVGGSVFLYQNKSPNHHHLKSLEVTIVRNELQQY